MKRLVFGILLIAACSPARHNFRQPVKACTVKKVDKGSEVKCPNQPKFTIPTIKGDTGAKGKDGVDGKDGKNGAAGTNGSNGADGKSCTVTQLSNGAKISCTDGSIAYIYNGEDGEDGEDGIDGQDGEDGADGQDGIDGQNGQDGEDGSSCMAIQMSNGVLISCADGTQGFLSNGADGQDGQDGEDGVDGVDGQDGEDGADAVLEVINPCGVEGNFEELLFRLSDGNIYGVFYNHSHHEVFMTKLVPGNYVTTDSYECQFTVTSSLNVVW